MEILIHPLVIPSLLLFAVWLISRTWPKNK
jgi:hypothetical protein